MLLFLRAPRGGLAEASRIFLHHSDARVTGSSFLESQPPNALSSVFIHNLLRADFSAIRIRERVIAKVVLPYLAGLYGCCYAIYHRDIAPRALKNSDLLRANHDTLFDEVRDLSTLQREIEIFLSKLDQNGIEQSDWPIPIQRQLSGLIDDVKNLVSFYRADDASSASDYLGGKIQAQVDEAKEAKKTSAKFGLLSQLAYIFLPLQVTVSALGMNLKAFGTGNIEIQSFFIILMITATLSFVPVLSPMIPGKRISDIRAISKHSRRLAFLCGWFCLCHWSTTNSKLFNCGIAYDLNVISGRYDIPRRTSGGHSQWSRKRTEFVSALQRQPVIFFPRYWKKVVEEIFDIIDQPNWGRDANHLHTA